MATVIRNGQKKEIHTSEIVPRATSSSSPPANLVPADARVIEADDCFVNQSALTGESLPSEKHAGALAPTAVGVGDMDNVLFFGTSVITGTAKAVVFATGAPRSSARSRKKLIQPKKKANSSSAWSRSGISS